MLEILLVDDDPALLTLLSAGLLARGHRVATAERAEAALARLGGARFDVVVTDLRMPDTDGLSLLGELRKRAPETPVVVLTGHGSSEEAVRAMRAGAAEYLRKPCELDELSERLSRAAGWRLAARSPPTLTPTPAPPAPRVHPPSALVGEAPPMRRLRELIARFAPSDAPVLILGESGSGKELAAEALHRGSPRARQPFVALNCAAFPEALLEAELFGHERGAFTGAVRKRVGQLQAAHGGTLFLDEVGEMSQAVQAKLLRALEGHAFQPLGTNEMVTVDVRVLAATHRDLKAHVARGLFREDLYYRLKFLEVHVPPLRERREDLPLLCDHFLRKFARDGATCRLSPRTQAALLEHPFPGNVRELEHALRFAALLCPGEEIDLEHLPPDIAASGSQSDQSRAERRTLPEALREFEREYLRRTLQLTSGKRVEAARLLGISRKSLWERLRRHGLAAPGEYEPED
ncbi:MAG TPA: sigma-54 dependent transcriptional regulator [Myxococcales bacterium]|nr:sigma-54 dependent transcriptional regulator [Myxococcales bacterium]